MEDIDKRNVRPVIFIAYGLEAEEVLYEWYRKVSGLTPGLLTSQQALLFSTKERELSSKLKGISGIDNWLKVVDLDDKPSIGGAIVEAFTNVCSPAAAANARVENWSMDLNEDPPIVYFIFDGVEYRGESFAEIFDAVQIEFRTNARQGGMPHSHSFFLSPRMTEGHQHDTYNNESFTNSAKLLLEITPQSTLRNPTKEFGRDNHYRPSLIPLDTHSMGGSVEAPGTGLRRNVVDLMMALMEYSVGSGARAYPEAATHIISSLRCGLPVEEIIQRGRVDFISKYFSTLHGADEDEGVEESSEAARDWLRGSGLLGLHDSLQKDPKDGRRWAPTPMTKIKSTEDLKTPEIFLDKYWNRFDNLRSFLAKGVTQKSLDIEVNFGQQIESWLESKDVTRNKILARIKMLRGVGGQTRSIATAANDNIEDLDYAAVMEIEKSISLLPKVPRMMLTGAGGIVLRLEKLEKEERLKASDLESSIEDDDGESINTDRLDRNQEHSDFADFLLENCDNTNADIEKLKILTATTSDLFCVPVKLEDQHISGWDGTCEQVRLPSGKSMIIPSLEELRAKEDERRSVTAEIEQFESEKSNLPDELLTAQDQESSEAIIAKIKDKEVILASLQKQFAAGKKNYSRYKHDLCETSQIDSVIEIAKNRLDAEFRCTEILSAKCDIDTERAEQKYEEYCGETKKEKLKKFIFASVILFIAPIGVGWGLLQLYPGTNPEILGDKMKKAILITEDVNDRVAFSIDSKNIHYQLPAGTWEPQQIVQLLNNYPVAGSEIKVITKSSGFDVSKLAISEVSGAILVANPLIGNEHTVGVIEPSVNSGNDDIGLEPLSRSGGGIWSTPVWESALWIFVGLAAWQLVLLVLFVWKRNKKESSLWRKVSEEKEKHKRLLRTMEERPPKYADFVIKTLVSKSVFSINGRTSKMFEDSHKRVEAYFSATDSIIKDNELWVDEGVSELPRSREFFSFLSWSQVNSHLLGGKTHTDVFDDAFGSFAKSWPAQKLWAQMDLDSNSSGVFPEEWENELRESVTAAFKSIKDYEIDNWLSDDDHYRLFDSGTLLDVDLKQLIRPLSVIDPDEIVSFRATAQVPDKDNKGGCTRIFSGLLSALTASTPHISTWNNKAEVSCLLISEGIMPSHVVFIHDSVSEMVSKCIADGDTEYLLSLEPTKLASCCDVRRAILRKGDYESLIAKFTTAATEGLVTADSGVLCLTSNGEEHVLGRGIVDVLLSMLELVSKGTIDVPSQSVHSRPEDASAAWESFCDEWRYSKDFLALRDVGDIVQVVKNGWA